MKVIYSGYHLMIIGFVMMVESYIKAFNSGLSPEILGTWESIALIENQKLLKLEIQVLPSF
jgi:hypothetical protein